MAADAAAVWRSDDVRPPPPRRHRPEPYPVRTSSKGSSGKGRPTEGQAARMRGSAADRYSSRSSQDEQQRRMPPPRSVPDRDRDRQSSGHRSDAPRSGSPRSRSDRGRQAAAGGPAEHQQHLAQYRAESRGSNASYASSRSGEDTVRYNSGVRSVSHAIADEDIRAGFQQGYRSVSNPAPPDRGSLPRRRAPSPQGEKRRREGSGSGQDRKRSDDRRGS